MSRVAIIGSGISACACAVSLKERGVDFTVFEKEGQAGGKICTEQEGPFVIEGGPDSFLPEKFWTLDLIRTVGLEDELLTTNDQFKGTYIYSRGALRPLPEGVMLMVPTMIMPLLRSSLISLTGKIRMGLEPFLPRKKDNSDESLASFVTRRLGRECLEKIAEPLVAGIHTANPDNMSVKAIFPRFLEMERKHGSLVRGMIHAMKQAPKAVAARKMTYFMSLCRGMQQLVDGCLDFIGRGNLKTGTAVQAIGHGTSGYTIDTGGERLLFDDVVVATPSYVTQGLVQGLDKELSDLLSSIEWSSTATISLGYSDLRKDLPGFGFIVPRIEGRLINAVTWSSVKWAGRAPEGYVLLRAFVGGGHHEELVFLQDEELTGIVQEELRHIAGIDNQPVMARIYRWVKSMPRYKVGHLDLMKGIEERLTRLPGLHLIGCSYRGIGIGDCVKSGFDAASAIATPHPLPPDQRR